jgi:hypothetical protein
MKLQISVYMLRLLRLIPLNYQRLPCTPGKSAQYEAQYEMRLLWVVSQFENWAKTKSSAAPTRVTTQITATTSTIPIRFMGR